MNLRRVAERDARVLRGLDEDRALVELRKELGAEPRDEDHRGAEDGDGDADHECRPAHRRTEDASVAVVEPPFELHRVRRLARALAEDEARGGRHEGEREEQAPEQRHRDRDRHRPEHPPLEPLQRHDRHVDEHDDEDAEGDRATDLAPRGDDAVTHVFGSPRFRVGRETALARVRVAHGVGV